MNGIMTTTFAAAAGLTYFLPVSTDKFLENNQADEDITATIGEALGRL